MARIHASASAIQTNRRTLETRPRRRRQSVGRCSECNDGGASNPKARVFLAAAVLAASACVASASSATAFVSPSTVRTVADSVSVPVVASPFSPMLVVTRGHRLSANRFPAAEFSPFSVPFAGKAGRTSSPRRRDGIDVTIERTSPNSRRISGEAIALSPLEDVWAILTDYDNLSTHVPNLVESRRVTGGSGKYNSARGTNDSSRPGDGSYRCRLYQRGAQKIFGFKFGADVTMDMSERVEQSGERAAINFECVDSQFFTEFNGAWTLEALDDKRTIVRYVVDVRPKGPVPVAALEWRIMEEVPTNLLSIKSAAAVVGRKLAQQRRRQEKGCDLMP